MGELALARALASSDFEIISWTGDGTYGSSNAKSITFSFPPKVLILGGGDAGTAYEITGNLAHYIYRDRTILATDMVDTTYKSRAWLYYWEFNSSYTDTNLYSKKSADGRTFTWYDTTKASYMLNTDGKKYYIIGIG